MEFGKTIASFRQKWGIEQKDLAKAIGVSKTYISIIECGSRKPSMRVLTKIADYFEVPISVFVYESSKLAGTQKNKKEKQALQVVDSLIQELTTFLMSESKGVAGTKRRSARNSKQPALGKKKPKA